MHLPIRLRWKKMNCRRQNKKILKDITTKDHRVHQGRKDRKEILDLRVLKVIGDLKVNKAHLDLMGLKDQKDIPDQLDHQVLVVLPVIRAIKETRVILV